MVEVGEASLSCHVAREETYDISQENRPYIGSNISKKEIPGFLN